MAEWVSRGGKYPNFTKKETVSAEADITIKIPGGRAGSNISITAIPGVGGSATVQYSTSLDSEVAAETATFQTWPEGTVTTITSDTVFGASTAVKLVATTADAIFEINI